MTTNPVTAGIAQLVGRDELDVALRLGGGWTRPEMVFDPESPQMLEPADVFVFGEPLQLVAVRLFDGLQWAVGAAKVEWATQMPVLTMAGQVLFQAGDDLESKADEVRQLLLSRRSSFRYCDLCGAQMAPEYREDDNVCQGCASDWLGAVY